MKELSELKRNLKKDFSGLKKIRVAVLGDSATQFLVQAIKGTGFDYGLDLEVWEADFNQIERQVFDPNSELYKFNPEIVILFRSTHKLLGKYNKMTGDQDQLASKELVEINELYSKISDDLHAKFIYFNYTEIDDSIFGSFAKKTRHSFPFQLAKLNFELMDYASKKPNFFLCDISAIQNALGKENFFQPSIYVNSEMVLSLNSLPYVAAKTVDIISAIQGKMNKCVIIDLDNTTWGGVIGDDGIENIQIGSLGIGKAFTEFQYWIKKLKNRGIIVAVCSKNTESVAKEPFEKHPDMVLSMEDISIFVANWENKADNIRHIQSVLNIGFDSMVFLDDNAMERSLVRENIPEITVPELPKDPAEYLEYLYNLNLFETTSYTQEDTERTKLYQTESKRASNQSQYTDLDAFLENLNMQSKIEPFNKFNIPRVAQLSQRSNQFNLRTVRYSEAEISALSNSENHATFAFTLDDKFGSNGLICVIILKKENLGTLFIDTWLMSCRVLKRGMENFVLNTIVDFAIANNYSTVKGEFIPTTKNELVKNHYIDLGFTKDGDYWLLETQSFEKKKNLISKV